MNYLAGWKTESIQTVNVVMWNKTVLQANDSDVCAPSAIEKKKGKIIHKRNSRKKNEMEKGCWQQKCV